MSETFFKVKPVGFGSGCVVVQYRRRMVVGSRLLAESVVLPAEHESGADAVEFGKRYAVQRYEARQDAMQKLRDALGETA